MSPDLAALINITCLEFPGEGSLFPAVLPNFPVSVTSPHQSVFCRTPFSDQGLGSKISVLLAVQ